MSAWLDIEGSVNHCLGFQCMTRGRVVAIGAVVGAATGILAGFVWRGHNETRTTIMANAVLLVWFAGASLFVVPRLIREKLTVPGTRRLHRGAALALAASAVAMVGVGVTASAPRPVIAYIVIGGGLVLLLAGAAFWVLAGRLPD